MISDSLVDPAASQEDKWKKAFRITIQKCILGTVIAATGTRAIYFTVQVSEIKYIIFKYLYIYFFFSYMVYRRDGPICCTTFIIQLLSQLSLFSSASGLK